MQLSEIVECSHAIRSTRSRLTKIDRLAELLADAPTELLPQLVSYLSGELPQGKIGVGYATVYDIDVAPARKPELTLGAVDTALSEIGGMSGAGSTARRRARLTDLMQSATRRSTPARMRSARSWSWPRARRSSRRS